jgi:dCMP deaminase
MVVAKRSTCMRLHVGCVLVDREYRVLATGYNGAARGQPHCDEHTCIGHDTCDAIHAEQNALIQCRDVDRIHACFVTTAPCIACMKLLMVTDCEAIYYHRPHPKMDLRLWTNSGRLAVRVKPYVEKKS